MEKKSRNNLVMYVIVYNIFFDRNEKQQNKLKILIKKKLGIELFGGTFVKINNRIITKFLG